MKLKIENKDLKFTWKGNFLRKK